MKDATKARKPVHRTASPFAQPKAYEKPLSTCNSNKHLLIISQNRSQLQQPQHDAIAQLLVNILKPIGDYRTNLPKSTKARNKKRKRKAKSAEEAKSNEDAMEGIEVPRVEPPRIQGDVLVGFNAVTRHLETLSTFSSKNASNTKEGEKLRHVAAVFLLRELDDLIYSHLPTMCHTASLAHPELPATRLALLDHSVEKKVAAALEQSPNVSVLALLEAAEEDVGSKGLIDYVREEVAAVDVPWLKQATDAQWLGTNINVQ